MFPQELKRTAVPPRRMEERKRSVRFMMLED
jgi:hypothetical protein